LTAAGAVRAWATQIMRALTRALLPLLAVVACGGEVSRPPAPLEKAAADYATARCEKTAECAGAGATPDSTTIATCVQFFTQHQIRRSALEGLREGVEELTTCARSIRSQACDEFLSGNWPGCFGHGTKKNGETCLWDEQCESGFCGAHNLAIDEHCGTCSPHPQEADPCAVDCGLLFDLPHGLTCALDATGVGQCVPLGLEGASCDSGKCETDLICTPPSDPAKSCSVPSAGPGDACDLHVGPFCDTRRGIYCNLNTHTCVLPRVVGEGNTCGWADDASLLECDARTFCSRSSGTDPTGTCVARFLPDGSECQAGNWAPPQCAFPAICARAPGATTGTCRVVGTDYCSVR
jgi:hypothetical protein